MTHWLETGMTCLKTNKTNPIRKTNVFCRMCLTPKTWQKRLLPCRNCNHMDVIANRPARRSILNPLNLLGIELEGMWNYNADDRTDGYLEQREDCSVENEDEYDCDWIGEYVFSNPLSMTSKTDDYSVEMPLWKWVVREGYPDHVNDTCGGHFHTSWVDMRFYELLMEEEMGFQCKQHMIEWGYDNLNETGQDRLFHRIKHGYSDYCKMFLEPESQVSGIHGRGDRYTFFNYPFHKHTTIECRFLPQFEQATTYISAVEEVIEFMKQWILKSCGAKYWFNRRTNMKIDIKNNTSENEIRRHMRRSHNFTSTDINELIEYGNQVVKCPL